MSAKYIHFPASPKGNEHYMLHNITAKPVTKSTYRDVVLLRSHAHQQFGAKPVLEELSKCVFRSNPVALALHKEDAVVGFALVSDYRDEQKLRLFMIGKEHQGKGYARPALASVLAYTAKPVHLNVHVDNTAAIKIYAEAGFAEYDRKKEYIYMRRDATLPADI